MARTRGISWWGDGGASHGGSRSCSAYRTNAIPDNQAQFSSKETSVAIFHARDARDMPRLNVQ